MRSSRLPAVKTLADFDISFELSLKREQIEMPGHPRVRQTEGERRLLGPRGVDKPHLAGGLAIAAPQHCRRV